MIMILAGEERRAGSRADRLGDTNWKLVVVCEGGVESDTQTTAHASSAAADLAVGTYRVDNGSERLGEERVVVGPAEARVKVHLVKDSCEAAGKWTDVFLETVI